MEHPPRQYEGSVGDDLDRVNFVSMSQECEDNFLAPHVSISTPCRVKDLRA